MAKTNAKPKTNKPATKSEILSSLAEATGLKKQQVADVLDKLGAIIQSHLRKEPRIVTLPGLLKFKVNIRPATAAKQGINPFTKEPMMIKAKPERKVVRVMAVKALKDGI